MSKIFYYGLDNKVHGPYDEQQAQKWYTEGYFSSDTQFQISLSEHFDQRERIYTLGELIDHNSRTLPFYFSGGPHKNNSDNEELLNTLLQEVESLRVSCNEKAASGRAEDKDTIDALRSQIASLVESHSDLRARLDTLTSHQKDNGAAKEIEKKVNELKRRVDEQEKNQTAMKKEISAVTSKCDRNDTKLSALLEKQKTAESMTDGFDKRISDLKDSEKSIRDTLKSCEESTATSSTQLESIKKDLGQIRTEMESDRKVSSTGRSELETVKKGLSEVQGVIKRDREDHAQRVAKSEEKSIKESTQNGQHSQPLQQSAPVVDEDREPWATATTPAASKAAKPETPDLPPWEKTAKTIKKNDSAPWDSSQPHDEAEPEPWAMNGTSHKESVQATKKEVKGVTIEQKAKSGTVQAVVGTVREAVQPISRVKNWDAICRELSDDEEEEEKVTPQSMGFVYKPLTRDVQDQLVGDFVRVLRWYVTALNEAVTVPEYPVHDGYLIPRLAMAATDAPEMLAVATVLSGELSMLAKQSVLRCSRCAYDMLTPINLIDHLIDPAHVKIIEQLADPIAHPVIIYAKCVENALAKFSILHKRLSPFHRDNDARQKGMRRLAAVTDHSRLRPTPDFQTDLVLSTTEKMVRETGKKCKLNPVPSGDVIVCGLMRAWFNEGPNRFDFLEAVEKHLGTGVPHCHLCGVAFDTAEEYLQHHTTYGHTRSQDVEVFGEYVRLCRIPWDWSI